MMTRSVRRAEGVRLVVAVAVAVLALGCGAGEGAPAGPDGGSAAGSADVSSEAPAPPAPAGPGASTSDGPGAYVTLADFERDPSVYVDDDVVLFFTAPWCSSCKETRENIEGDLDGIPAGLVIVTVDYDSEDELRQAHGVTVQHTFVQIDRDGATVKKWTGSLTAEAIAEQTV